MTGIIILAAGSSSRMGRAKQNLVYKGKTLLQNAIETALSAKPALVAVVLGANADAISSTLTDLDIPVFINKDWADGMGSTINYGLREVLKIQSGLSSVVFMLADQPLVTTSILTGLIKKASAKKIIASAYNNTQGPPILFDKVFFPDLLAMEGNDGAKNLLLKYPDAVIALPFADGAFDIDTPEDYEKLSS